MRQALESRSIGDESAPSAPHFLFIKAQECALTRPTRSPRLRATEAQESTRRKVKESEESETRCVFQRADSERVTTLCECERGCAASWPRAGEKEPSRGCRENNVVTSTVLSVALLPVRICVDPGGSRETKRIITRPRASVVPSGPSLTRPLARVSVTIPPSQRSVHPSVSLSLCFSALPSRVCTSHAFVVNKYATRLTGG
jgi:hypothetical protein